METGAQTAPTPSASRHPAGRSHNFEQTITLAMNNQDQHYPQKSDSGFRVINKRTKKYLTDSSRCGKVA
jgi:hypothetical protein